MKITLRSIDQTKVPEVPALTSDRNLKAETKNDVLSYIEMDSNFANILSYLKDINDVIGSISNLSDLNQVKSQLNAINTKVTDLLNGIDRTKDIDKPISKLQQKALDLKLDKDNIKTINGKSLLGTGDLDVKISDQELKSKLSTLGNFEPGCYGIFTTQSATTTGQILSGTSLMNPDGTNLSGTWRQCGTISSDKAIFFRII